MAKEPADLMILGGEPPGRRRFRPFVPFYHVYRVVTSIKKEVNTGLGGLIDVGILCLSFSFILLWSPLFAGMTVIIYTAMAFVFVGVSYFYLAFRLRKLKKMML